MFYPISQEPESSYRPKLTYTPRDRNFQWKFRAFRSSSKNTLSQSRVYLWVLKFGAAAKSPEEPSAAMVTNLLKPC
jgi:hypothetical protein